MARAPTKSTQTRAPCHCHAIGIDRGDGRPLPPLRAVGEARPPENSTAPTDPHRQHPGQPDTTASTGNHAAPVGPPLAPTTIGDGQPAPPEHAPPAKWWPAEPLHTSSNLAAPHLHPEHIPPPQHTAALLHHGHDPPRHKGSPGCRAALVQHRASTQGRRPASNYTVPGRERTPPLPAPSGLYPAAQINGDEGKEGRRRPSSSQCRVRPLGRSLE